MHKIVGSLALQQNPFYKLREPKDLDIWCSSDSELVKYKKSKADVKIFSKDILSLFAGNGTYATPNDVYTIKLSHLGWDSQPLLQRQWWKHFNDMLHLKKLGCTINVELYRSLIKHWKSEFGNKEFLSLKQDKKEFFTDHVNYKIDHDLLHEIVAFPDKPTYNLALRDGEQVLIDNNKFFNLTYEQQIQMLKEEIHVIAIERFIVNGYSPHKAYSLALKKTITNLTKNWVTEFLVLNAEKFLVLDEQMMNNFLSSKYNNSDIMKEEINIMSDKILRDIFEEIKLEDNGISYHDFISEFLPYGELHGVDETFITHLDQNEQGEDCGEYCYAVFSFKDKIYKAEYSHYSYNGFEFDYMNVFEVQAKTKEVVIYE